MNASLFKQVFLLLLTCIMSCNNSSKDETPNSEVVCTTVVVPAISITVIDKASGNTISCGATAIIEDTNFSEEISNPASKQCDNSILLHGAYEREGIYNVHVFKEGYLDWSEYNIEVKANVCHVETVTIEAALEK